MLCYFMAWVTYCNDWKCKLYFPAEIKIENLDPPLPYLKLQHVFLIVLDKDLLFLAKHALNIFQCGLINPFCKEELAKIVYCF